MTAQTYTGAHTHTHTLPIVAYLAVCATRRPPRRRTEISRSDHATAHAIAASQTHTSMSAIPTQHDTPDQQQSPSTPSCVTPSTHAVDTLINAHTHTAFFSKYDIMNRLRRLSSHVTNWPGVALLSNCIRVLACSERVSQCVRVVDNAHTRHNAHSYPLSTTTCLYACVRTHQHADSCTHHARVP
jgi:hypothetical protein